MNSVRELNLEPIDGEPAITYTIDGDILSVRHDVAGWMEEEAKELGVRVEDMLTLVLALGLHTTNKELAIDMIPAELKKNPKVMALFK